MNQSSLNSREIAVFDMSTTFFTTHSRQRCHSLMLLSMKRCYSVIITLELQFFHLVKFSSVIDPLLKGTTNSIIHWIKISAVC